MGDNKNDDLARAILIVGEQIAAGLQSVAASNEDVAKAISALISATPKADKLVATLVPNKGAKMFAKTEAPLTVNVGATGTTTVVETAKGVIVPLVGPLPITFASDNPAVATYAADGTWAAVGVGTCNMSQLDPNNGLTDSTPLTVQAAPPPVADTLIGTLVPNVAKKQK